MVIGMPQEENSMTNVLCMQCVKRVVQLESTVDMYINRLDLGTSGIYTTEDTLRSAIVLSSILDQMSADLATIINLLDE